jgi:hypothetical protein
VVSRSTDTFGRSATCTKRMSLLNFKSGWLSEAAMIIGEGDTPEERGLLDS